MNDRVKKESAITRWLSSTSSFKFSVYCIIAAFSTYFCMYAFRKPFSAATYAGMKLWGMDYKIVLIIAQVMGYMISKFVGIRVVSSMPPQKRALSIIVTVALGELALLLFGFFPYPYGWVFLFMNGLPLGMVWGLVFSFIEGRRLTEALASGLCASFILSSGVVKATGKWLMLGFHLSETWMPFTTGMIYLLPLLASVWLLSKIPPPTEEEVKNRSLREPMTTKDRRKLIADYGVLLILMIVVYCFLTGYRDFRDNFAADMWITLGYANSSDIFALTEIPVALTVLIVLGTLFKIQDNRKAVLVNHVMIALGILLLWVSTLLVKNKIIGPVFWSILTGTGVYLAYVPFNGMLFDRIVAMLRYKSNAGFLIYIGDSLGYLSSIIVLLVKSFFAANISAYRFMVDFGIYTGLIPFVMIIFSGISFMYVGRKKKITIKVSEQAKIFEMD